jgi:hypothetical protein
LVPPEKKFGLVSLPGAKWDAPEKLDAPEKKPDPPPSPPLASPTAPPSPLVTPPVKPPVPPLKALPPPSPPVLMMLWPPMLTLTPPANAAGANRLKAPIAAPARRNDLKFSDLWVMMERPQRG